MDAIELKWNDFKQNVELHRSYLELAIKLNMFYYAVTGAILSFYFANTGIPMVEYALVLPFLLSIALAGLFLWSAVLAHGLRTHIRETAAELGLKAYPEGIVLVLICSIFGAVLVLVSIGLVYFFFAA